MNWLAHLLLSEPNVESRLGNLLADIVKGSARQQLNLHLQRGIQCHQFIDAYTDSHFVFQRSKQRISSKYRRFAGILIDVFYDHFLAKNWSKYSHVSLEDFTTEIYKSFLTYPAVPTEASEIISRMATEDWLGSYRHVAGVEKALAGISNRLSMRRRDRTFDLHLSVHELISHYKALEEDFYEFFPDLRLSVQTQCFA